jgi:hypothetical protein
LFGPVNFYVSALLIPAAPGALHDLKDNEDLAVIIKHFVKEKRPPKWYNIACTTNQYYQRRPYVNTATKITELPALTAQATIAGIETAHMIRKGQLFEENIPAYKQFMALAG